jgi:hypothetical protein
MIVTGIARFFAIMTNGIQPDSTFPGWQLKPSKVKDTDIVVATVDLRLGYLRTCNYCNGCSYQLRHVSYYTVATTPYGVLTKRSLLRPKAIDQPIHDVGTRCSPPGKLIIQRPEPRPEGPHVRYLISRLLLMLPSTTMADSLNPPLSYEASATTTHPHQATSLPTEVVACLKNSRFVRDPPLLKT